MQAVVSLYYRGRRIQRDNPYFQMLSGEWSKALRKAFAAIEAFDI